MHQLVRRPGCGAGDQLLGARRGRDRGRLVDRLACGVAAAHRDRDLPRHCEVGLVAREQQTARQQLLDPGRRGGRGGIAVGGAAAALRARPLQVAQQGLGLRAGGPQQGLDVVGGGQQRGQRGQVGGPVTARRAAGVGQQRGDPGRAGALQQRGQRRPEPADAGGQRVAHRGDQAQVVGLTPHQRQVGGQLQPAAHLRGVGVDQRGDLVGRRPPAQDPQRLEHAQRRPGRAGRPRASPRLGSRPGTRGGRSRREPAARGRAGPPAAPAAARRASGAAGRRGSAGRGWTSGPRYRGAIGWELRRRRAPRRP